jgi:predicted RNase H-like HicB family nuclease
MAEFRRYVAVIEQNKRGRYFARMPDLPGVTSGGGTIDEALRYLADFADDHVADLAKDQHEIPDASAWEDVPSDPDVDEVLRAYVPVRIPARVPRTTKISISINEDLLDRIDHAAAQMGESRSGFLATAAAERAVNVLTRPFDQEKFLRDLEKAGGLGAVLKAIDTEGKKKRI